jgi:effector-binding domain-containing protein
VPEQLQALASIRALRDLGASLQDIRRMKRRELLEKLREGAEQSLASARRSLAWIDGQLEDLNSLERPVAVVVKRRPSVRVASIRAKVSRYAEIAEIERELSEVVSSDVAGRMRGVLWHRCADSGSLEGEAFLEIRRDVARRRSCEIKQLPSVTVASAYCESEEEAAEQAYDALRRWLHVHGYGLAGPKREIYLGRMLEIQFPLQSA